MIYHYAPLNSYNSVWCHKCVMTSLNNHNSIWCQECATTVRNNYHSVWCYYIHYVMSQMYDLLTVLCDIINVWCHCYNHNYCQISQIYHDSMIQYLFWVIPQMPTDIITQLYFLYFNNVLVFFFKRCSFVTAVILSYCHQALVTTYNMVMFVWGFISYFKFLLVQCMETWKLPGKGFNFFINTRELWSLSSDGSLPCHTYTATRDNSLWSSFLKTWM